MQVQLNQKQIIELYQGLDIEEDTTMTACRIAARKLVLNTTTDPKAEHICNAEIAELTLKGDPLVRIDKFKDQIFSLNPTAREEEFRLIDKERAERVGLLFEEKKIKRDALQKAEARKNKAMFDFENNLGGLQYARGVMSKERLGRLEELIAYCQLYLHWRCKCTLKQQGTIYMMTFSFSKTVISFSRNISMNGQILFLHSPSDIP
jgi:hypothetical protein